MNFRFAAVRTTGKEERAQPSEFRPLQVPRFRPRQGVTTLEVVVATILLAVAISGLGTFSASMHDGLQNRELSARIAWEVANAREQIGCWNFEEVRQAKIEALPVSAALAKRMEQTRWVASVDPILTPIDGLRVQLALHGVLNQQPVVPRELTFWIPRPEEED